MQMSGCVRWTAVGLLWGLLCAADGREVTAQTPGGDLSGLDAYITGAMRDWEVSSLAIGILKGQAIVSAKGYGTRSVERPGPVDAHTVFAIGSATKAFTSTLAAMMVGEGKMRWDEPVTTHLPTLQFYDPYASRELTLRDLLAHRTGLPRGDFLWYANGFDRAEILRRLRFLPPASSLRSRFSYSNIGYLAAGEAVAAAGGNSWDDLLRERILAPLDMRETTSSVRALANVDNLATPHDPAGKPIPWLNADNIAPAGAINSTVSDMLKWMRFQLSEGQPAGTPLVNPAALRETRTAQQVVPLGAGSRQLTPFTNFLSYGMGWNLSDHRGRVLHSHGGNLQGMSAQVALMPDDDLGIVVLTNRESSPLATIVAFRAIDAMIGALPRDWSAEYRKAVATQKAAAAEADQRRLAQRLPGTTPSLPLAQYVGAYTDNLYGDAKVWLEGSRLMMSYGRLYQGELEHWHLDTFRAQWRVGNAPLVTFQIDAGAKVGALNLEAVGTLGRVR